MNKKLIEDIANTYYAALTNKEVRQPRYIVLFSGVVGSGKSTIARAIEHNLRAVRVSNDEIRDRIVVAVPMIQPEIREEVKLKIGKAIMSRLSQETSGLIVVDASCDRGFNEYYESAKRNGYRVILLRLEIPRDVIERRIRERGDLGYRDVARSLNMLDTWWRQWEAFGKTHKPDMIITQETDIQDVFKLVKGITSGAIHAITN